MGTMADLIANYDPNKLAFSNQRNQADIGLTRANTGLVQQQTTQEGLKNQILQQSLRDQDIFQRAYVNTDGSPDKVFKYAVQNGISAKGGMDLQQHFLDLKNKA